eukprot:660370_1
MVIQASVGDHMDCGFGAVYPSFTRSLPSLNKIKLTVYQHHGHYKEDAKPDNLLDGSNDTDYTSVRGKTSGDWITFRMNNPAYIRKIRIVNADDDYGIRCIALFVGSDKPNSKWIKLRKTITNIKRKKSVQEFDIIHSLSDYFMFKNQLNLLKIQILKNHGSTEYN